MEQTTRLQNFRPLLEEVRVTDAYAHRAFTKEIGYLLSLETGRLLAGFYENAGLRTPYVRYGGWESMLIGGHTLGHVLSALSRACVTCGGEEKAALSARIRALVDGLSECQDAVGTGLVWGAAPVEGGIEAQFDNVEKLKTNIKTQAWVPWYTLHKILAGLLDVHVYCGDPAALRVARRLGDWVAGRTSRWSAAVNRKVLSVEYGGMNDALYTLYRMTGEPAYRAAAEKFDEEKFFSAVLTEGKDVLDGKHANTQIPKIVGALNRYFTCGEERYLRVAEAFFRMVTERHTYVTGGNSEWEHFGKDYVLDAERTKCNCETCNVYNMLKLARGLFAATGDKRYLDYDDIAFTNTILSSQNPETGMTTYFQPMAGGYFKVFSRPYDKFWCCTGSGMENFSKLGEGICYLRGDTLVIARYLSSEIRVGSSTVRLHCELPFCEEVRIGVTGGDMSLLLRIPDWCAGEPALTVNGVRRYADKGAQGEVSEGFLPVHARDGDEIVLTLPVAVTLHGLPDSKDVYAFCYGNTVLSADLGREDMEEGETGVEVTVPKRRIIQTETVCFPDVADVLSHPSRYLVREGEQFFLRGGDISLTFAPHYKRYRERYAIYFRLCEGKRGAEVEERTPVDVVQPGYGQYETDELHALEERNSVGVTSDGTYRFARAGGYFQYDFRVCPHKHHVLAVTLRKGDDGHPLNIFAGEELIFRETLLCPTEEEEYTREIAIADDVLSRNIKKKEVAGEEVFVLTVRFEGEDRKMSAKVCNFLRMYAQ